MRIFFVCIILALIGSDFALYADPPISEVMSHNSQVQLLEVMPENATDNCIVETDPSLIAERGAIDKLTMQVVSAFPAIDNRVSPANPPYIFWTYGEQHKETITWETELSGTACTSSAEFVNVTPEANIAFTIGSFSSSSASNENPVALPQEIKDLIGNTQERNITISMDGNVVFTYHLDVYSVVCTPDSGCSCEKNALASGDKELKFRCTNSISYEIENQDVVSLLQKPILKEQWYKNNHFDNVLLTNRKIYKAEITLNNNSIGNLTFYAFNVSTDKYGLERITTIISYSANGANGAENFANVTPTPLQEKNNTFKYSYEMNSTYPGLGWNTLTLNAYDDFGQKIELSDEILSRELSFSGNISESNKAIGGTDQNARPSSAWIPLTYNLLFITLGAVGLIIIFAVYKVKF